MADRRGSLVVPFLIITFIFLTPGPTGGPSGGPIQYRQTIQDVAAEEQHSLALLQNSSYIPQRFSSNQSYGLNLTGFEDDRGFAWDGLSQVQARVKEQLRYALGDDAEAQALELRTPDNAGPLYGNVTGFVHGKWVRSKLEANLSAPRLNLSDYAPMGPFRPLPSHPFVRNITGKTGEVRLNIHERDPQRLKTPSGLGEVVTDMDLELSISDDDSLQEHELRMHGVYFPTAGQALLTTTSDKFAGIFALPHLSLSESMFEVSRRLLNASIPRAINRQLNGEIGVFNPWTSNSGAPNELPFAAPECELVVYLQQLPPSGLPANFPGFLYFFEKELRFPTGAILPSAPDVHFSMVAFSPDCGYVLESKGPPDYSVAESNHLKGTKIEIIWTHGRHHLLIFSAAISLQLFLLMRQMREASTPSTRSKISFYTIAMLALGDGFTTMTFLLTSIFVHGLWVNLIGTAFVAFISVSFFGMRLLMDIWAVQAPERIRREREENAQRRERLQEAMQRVRAMRNQAAELRSQATGPPPGNTATNTASPQQPVDASGTVPNSNETTAPQSQAPDTTQPLTSPSANDTSNTEPANNILSESTESATNQPPTTATQQRPTDTGATPVFMPSDQDNLETAEDVNNMDPASNIPSFGALYTRFYLLLLATLFISLNAASWPSPFRRAFFTVVALLYLSFWLPQLHRNIQRNCRHALNWEFVFGQSVLRLVPFAYFYGYGHNVLFAERDLLSLALLALWVWIQVVLLVSQEIIGPRWFVRKDWAPPAYDYHPVLREDEEGATMPIGFSEATAAGAAGSPTAGRRGSVAREAKERPPGRRVFDCAICMQDLEVPVVEGSGGGGNGGGDANLGASLLARRTYMVTPCRHIFHTPCLEGWMKFRLQCPICRETLPPL